MLNRRQVYLSNDIPKLMPLSGGLVEGRQWDDSWSRETLYEENLKTVMKLTECWLASSALSHMLSAPLTLSQ